MRFYRMRRIHHAHSIRLPLPLHNRRPTGGPFTPRPRSSLLFPHPLKYIRIPPLPHIHMALHPIHQRRLPQMAPPPLRERELHIVDPLPASLLQPLVPQGEYLAGYVHALERGVVAHALEEGHAESGAEARARGEHAVGGAFADAVGEGFEALADGDDEGGGEGWAVDPVAGEVLGLQTGVRRDL